MIVGPIVNLEIRRPKGKPGRRPNSKPLLLVGPKGNLVVGPRGNLNFRPSYKPAVGLGVRFRMTGKAADWHRTLKKMEVAMRPTRWCESATAADNGANPVYLREAILNRFFTKHDYESRLAATDNLKMEEHESIMEFADRIYLAVQTRLEPFEESNDYHRYTSDQVMGHLTGGCLPYLRKAWKSTANAPTTVQGTIDFMRKVQDMNKDKKSSYASVLATDKADDPKETAKTETVAAVHNNFPKGNKGGRGKGRGRGRGGRGHNSGGNGPANCYCCGQPGHTVRTCPKGWFANNRGNGSNNQGHQYSRGGQNNRYQGNSYQNTRYQGYQNNFAHYNGQMPMQPQAMAAPYMPEMPSFDVDTSMFTASGN